MVSTVVDVEVLDELTSEAVFGEHTLHHAEEEGVHTGLEVFVVRLLHEHFGGLLTLAAGVAGVVKIDFVGHLGAGHHDFVGIDDDDMVAASYKGGVAGLVFATKNLCNFGAEAAEHLIGSIDNHPFLLHALGIRGNCFVT